MATNRLTAQQRAALAAMMVGQPTLFRPREEYSLELLAETLGGSTIRLETIIRDEDGVPALARLRRLVLALDSMEGCTVLAWKRIYPPTPTDPEVDEYLDGPLCPPSPPVGG